MDSIPQVLVFFVVILTIVNSAVVKPKWRGSSDGFKITTSTDGQYYISVNNVTWFKNSPTFFFADGQRFVAGYKLKLNQTSSTGGTDKFGQYTKINFLYQAGSSDIVAYIKTYNDHDVPFIIFGQHYVNGASKTSTKSRDYTIASFPGFAIDKDMKSLGFLSYGGMMFGDTLKRTGNWTFAGTDINYGIHGGPLAIFDQSGNTVIISSANNFMSTSLWHESFVDIGGAVHWGTMGLVNEVPADHLVETIVYFDNRGINKAFEGWGEYLRYRYNRDDTYVKSDLTVNYLGYWTDNGAYYYYKTEDNKTYEDTMIDVKTYSDQIKVPYRYLQYDSWWYYKGTANGVKRWESRPDVFPHGMQYVYNKTGLPVSGHNRYWARDTTYAKQNGGQYDFIVELLKSVPIQQKFWDDLFDESRKWGLITYEQDWLNDEFMGLEAFLTDINLGTLWLKQMGTAAMENGITIQYCMSLSREAMQTLEIPIVTQARVSNDYSPGRDQWKIGISSMFAYAMGVAPFKDDFWTTTDQPGNPYGRSEPYHALNAAVATLSTGPVGPSDKIGSSNATLIMRSCNTDGLILKPSKPMTAINDQILQLALGSGGPIGEVWTTYSRFGDIYFGIILAADISNTYSLTPSRAGFVELTKLKVFSMDNPSSIKDFSEHAPISITPSCTAVNFCLFYVSPIFNIRSHSIVILGELAKWVPVSPQRITQITADSDLIVTLTGKPGEIVNMYFNVDGATHTARVSNDYSPGRDQWKIGISSMFAYAMGVAPFKDDFWTTTDQPGNPYGRSEPYHALNAAVATLSTGPVGPSDKIGSSNATLIMRSCNTDGLILKPSKPMTAINDQILQLALGSGGPIGEVWTTYSRFGDIYFGIILAADISNTYSLTPSRAGFVEFTKLKVFSMNNPSSIKDFSEQAPISITPSCTAVNFCLFYVSPIFKIRSHSIVILGELAKWVPVSPQRITQIAADSDLIVTVTGKPGEIVNMYFNVDGATHTVSCILGSSGTGQIYVLALKCILS